MFNKRYQQAVYIKETNQENGPGHVSTSIIKKSEEDTIVNHTSFHPTTFGSIINALSLGSIPVYGKVINDLDSDLSEADHVLVKDITEKEYKAALKMQREFVKEVESGHHFYSVFGSFNPLATGFTLFFNTCKSAHKTAENHKDIEGFYPLEDHIGIPVFSNSVHVKVKESTIHNCVSSTCKILNAANIKIDNPVTPTNFTQELITEHGFERVDKEEFSSSCKM